MFIWALGLLMIKREGEPFEWIQRGVAFIPLIVDGILHKEPIPWELDPLFCMNVQKKFKENLKDFQ